MATSSHTASSTVALRLDRLAGVLAEAVVVPLRRREADHRHVIVVGPRSCCRRPGRSSSWPGRRWRRRARARRTARRSSVMCAAGSAGATGGSASPGASSGSTAWPPNCSRSAAIALMATPSWSWLTKRAYSAALITGRGDAALDRLLHGPPTLAGVLRDRREAVEAGALLEGAHEEVEQPRAHHAPLPPGRQRALGVDVEAGAGEQLVALGVGLHEAVLDAVVDHLREVAGAGRAGVDEAALGRQRVEHRLGEGRRARPRRRP